MCACLGLLHACTCLQFDLRRLPCRLLNVVAGIPSPPPHTHTHTWPAVLAFKRPRSSLPVAAVRAMHSPCPGLVRSLCPGRPRLRPGRSITTDPMVMLMPGDNITGEVIVEDEESEHHGHGDMPSTMADVYTGNS